MTKPSKRYRPENTTGEAPPSDDTAATPDGWGNTWLDEEAYAALVILYLSVLIPLLLIKITYQRLRKVVKERLP